MATTKATKKSSKQSASKGAAAKGAGGKAYSKNTRCWPGYVPVPGKGEHEQGSCRPEPASKNGGQPVNREVARKKQISMGGKRAEQAKSKSPSAAERRSVSKTAGTHRGTASGAKPKSTSSSTRTKKGTATKRTSTSRRKASR